MRAIVIPAAAFLAASIATAAADEARDRPDPSTTSGALNPAVTQANIAETICRRGWTASIRPPIAYTEDLKRRQLHEPTSPYFVAGARLRDFEEDHRVPLSIGGDPTDPRNLWPEPRYGRWNAEAKDELEIAVNHRVCAHRMTLGEGRAVFFGDWIATYRHHLEEQR